MSSPSTVSPISEWFERTLQPTVDDNEQWQSPTRMFESDPTISDESQHPLSSPSSVWSSPESSLFSGSPASSRPSSIGSEGGTWAMQAPELQALFGDDDDFASPASEVTFWLDDVDLSPDVPSNVEN